MLWKIHHTLKFSLYIKRVLYSPWKRLCDVFCGSEGGFPKSEIITPIRPPWLSQLGFGDSLYNKLKAWNLKDMDTDR